MSRGNVVVLPGSNIYFNYPASMPGHYINDPTKAQTAGFGNFNIDGHHSNLNLDFY
jgi:hypothetical protein